MKRNFCTLFDKNYLIRGLTMYNSLAKYCSQFTLWILCMDDESYILLQKLNLNNVKLLKINEVEDNRLRKVKPLHTSIEYCWMFSSSLPLHILENNVDTDMITYIDADILLYSSIEPIYESFGNNSIMIIPHNFSNKYAGQEKKSGIYNVGMTIFRNDKNGLECLRWWKDRVIEWCYNRYEDGKLGDQTYLNDWPTRFDKVCILSNHGANVASWNIDRYIFKKEDGHFVGTEKETGSKFPLIFYHFHGLKLYLNNSGKIRAYPIGIIHKKIYGQYISDLQNSFEQITKVDKNWNSGFDTKPNVIRLFKQSIQAKFIN